MARADSTDSALERLRYRMSREKLRADSAEATIARMIQLAVDNRERIKRLRKALSLHVGGIRVAKIERGEA